MSTNIEGKGQFKTSRMWLVGCSIIVCLLVAAIIALVFAIRASSSPIPAALRKQAPFSLYYPSGDRAGFSTTKERMHYDANTGVLIIPFRAANGHQITLAQQSAPPAVTYQDLLGQGEAIDGVEGQAAISHIEGRIVASVLTRDHTLLLLNSTTASSEEVTALVKTLKLLR